MNTIKITIIERHECLPFSELEPDVREKVMEEHGKWNVMFDWWDSVYAGFEEDCWKHYGIMVDLKGTYFRGFWSQGDGAAFTGRLTDIDRFLDHAKCPSEFRRVLRFMVDGMCLRPSTCPTGFRNTSQSIDFDRYGVNPHLPEENQQEHYNHAEKALDWLENAWEDVCTDLASELYSRLEREYEYQTSAEALFETFDANDCVFDIETGELFHREQAVA